jgi:hypothetical protein
MNNNLLSNRISLDIPGDDLQAIQAAVRTLQDKLVPHLVDLGPGDRRGMLRMGARSLDFVAKTLTSVTANPQLKPAFIDLDEFARDFAAVGTLRSLYQPLLQITDLLDDSLTVSGGEAYSAALACYETIKAASKRGLPGATTIADDLFERFARRHARADDAPPPAAPAAA